MKEFDPVKLFDGIDDVEVLKSLPNEYLHQKTILGIDIYKYSQYPTIEQIYIPVLFFVLYTSTVRGVIAEEPFLFSSYGLDPANFNNKFISTGDGGFQIFDNPVQAIAFALSFQMNIKRFVSGSNKAQFVKKLHKIIDQIEVRYAITTDTIYSFNGNYFGPGIINNARILSKDALNRLLIDSNTMKWFTNEINSVENLLIMTRKSFTQTNFFKDYDEKQESFLFDEQARSFKSVDVLKIGSIQSKNVFLDIYNLHLQATARFDVDKHSYNEYLITLGNLNTAGI